MTRKFLTGIDMSGQKITGSADGSAATDLVTKQQLDAALRGLDWKDSVRAVTTANITLTNTQTVDGVALAVGERVLVKNQTVGSANGIYVVATGAWTRAVDADANAEVTSGLAVTVTEGTTQGDTVWTLATNDPIVVGTTALTFAQVGGGGASYTAGAGLALSGSQFAVVPGNGILADGTSTRVDPSVVTRKFAQAVGNGALTSIPVVHNLGTQDVQVQVYDAATYDTVECDVVRTDVNTVTLGFAVAPTANAHRVVVQG
jgi:phage-related tail fiber protein